MDGLAVRWIERSVNQENIAQKQRSYSDPTADQAIANIMHAPRRKKRTHSIERKRVGVWRAEGGNRHA